jgi:WD40 repeat protein
MLSELYDHTSEVASVVALDDNALALSGSMDRTLRLWNIISGECVKVLHCGDSRDDQVFCVAVTA